MAEIGVRDTVAVTLAFDEFEGQAQDEAPLAAEVAARYGARHIVRRVTRAEFERDLPAFLDAMDLPTTDGINTWFVAKAAREAGVKVALSGLGADECFGGAACTGCRRCASCPASALCRAACSPGRAARGSACIPRLPASSSTVATGPAPTCFAAASTCRGNSRACSIAT
jgi:asparagine synthetase B (glutamine-hydrolysing)